MTEVHWITPGEGSSRVEKDHFERYIFAAQFVQGKNILDIACGSGYGSKLLRERGALNVHGVDISEEAISVARNRYAGQGISFFVSDAVAYRPSMTYDVVISLETIEQVPDSRALIEHFYEMLSPGGTLIISSINRTVSSPYANSSIDQLSNPICRQEFTANELCRALLCSGFNLGPRSLFGQRSQRYFHNRYIRRIYKILFRPDHTCSPEVRPIDINMPPRFIIAVAQKPNSHA